MSWKVSLRIDTGNGEMVQVSDDHTFVGEVEQMYRKAGLVKTFNDINGNSAKIVAATLGPIISYMVKNPKKMRKLNPSNTHNTYEGALEFLKEIAADCTRHPKCVVVVH
jgi:hypothetical protein